MLSRFEVADQFKLMPCNFKCALIFSQKQLVDHHAIPRQLGCESPNEDLTRTHYQQRVVGGNAGQLAAQCAAGSAAQGAFVLEYQPLLNDLANFAFDN